MSTEDNFETVNTVPTETSTEQPSSNENEIVQDTNSESTSKPEQPKDASENVDVDHVVQEVDEELLKVDKKRQARIGHANREHKRQRERQLESKLAAIEEKLTALTENQTSFSNNTPITNTNQSANPNLIWDESLQNWVNPDELIAYANNLRNKQSGSSNSSNAIPAQPQPSSVRSVGQPPPVQNTQPVNEPVSFTPEAEHQFKTVSERERREYNVAPNQLTNFELGIKEMYEDGLLTPALINGAALASNKGLETLYEWSQSDLGRDKIKEIKTYYPNPYQQATEIGRLVKARDEQRAARSRSHVPQQAQPLTESTSDIQDYFNRDMTTIINDHLKR